MRSGIVYCKGRRAGRLEERAEGYAFMYDADYLADASASSVSLTLPKTQQVYLSRQLFPFFVGLLTEGEQAAFQCRTLHLDREDYFGRLLACAGEDTIGAVTVKPESTEGC